MQNELQSIAICQSEQCQAKGSKHLLKQAERLQSEYASQYPQLQVRPFDCQGDCDQGPVMRVNENYLVRSTTETQIETLFASPDSVMGELQFVRDGDKEIFDRIVEGGLF